MITNFGKTYLKGYLVGLNPIIASEIAFGIGSTAPALGDSYLDFEVDRATINLISYDYDANQIVLKAELEQILQGVINEVALLGPLAQGRGIEDSPVITNFSSIDGSWSTNGGAAVYANDNADPTFTTRVGPNSLKHSPAASGTSTSVLEVLILDLSDFAGTDKFKFAYNVGTAFTSNVQFRFFTDASNYYTFSLGVQTAGYKIVSVAKSAATVTGAPSWSSISQVAVITTSGSGGASNVQFDALKVEVFDSLNPVNQLIARETITAYVRDNTKPQQVEFRINATL